MSLYKGTQLISGAIPDMANQSLSNINSSGQALFDAKVNKTGDTMTGNLTIEKSYPTIIARHTNLTFGTTPSSTYYGDTYKLADTNGNGMGSLSEIYQSDGAHFTRLWQKKSPSEDSYAVFDVGFNTSGNAICNFPNTTCCDGQYVQSSVQIANGVSVAGSSALTYTLSLPNDGRNYIVWLHANVTTGNASGNFAGVYVWSDLVPPNIQIARARTSTASAMTDASCVPLPVSSSHNIYVSRVSSWVGTFSMYMNGYRRMGTNS